MQNESARTRHTVQLSRACAIRRRCVHNYCHYAHEHPASEFRSRDTTAAIPRDYHFERAATVSPRGNRRVVRATESRGPLDPARSLSVRSPSRRPFRSIPRAFYKNNWICGNIFTGLRGAVSFNGAHTGRLTSYEFTCAEREFYLAPPPRSVPFMTASRDGFFGESTSVKRKNVSTIRRQSAT